MTAAGLKLAPGLTLPVEFATEGVAVIGMRGSGKSNTEVRFAELLSRANVPFCAVDPKGDWHGVRASADGKHPGLPVPVFGGLHGDFPLEPEMGKRIADLLVDEMLSAVLDVSAMSKTGGLPTFLTAFCNQLMHRHQLTPHVRTVILEEAHRYIPQEVRASGAALKEAAASLLLEGRAFGLGCWAATQRPARLHKDVLEEVGTAIIHRIGVSATNDMRTIAGWVKHYDLSPEIVASLTSLRAGEAWVLIPDLGIVKRVQVDRRTTFDSAATPKVGAVRRAPTNVADIDADKIRAALAEVVERAKANDPAELKKQVRRLEAELRKRPEETVEVERVIEQRVEVLPIGAHIAIQTLAEHAERGAEAARRLVVLIDKFPEASGSEPARAKGSTARKPVAAPHVIPPEQRAAAREVVQAVYRVVDSDVKLKAGARRMLSELAAWPNGLTDVQLSLRAKVKRSGGAWNTYLSTLRVAGFIENGGVGRVATQAGLDWLGVDPPRPRTPEEIRATWLSGTLIKAGARRMLQTLVDAYPEAVSRDDLSAAAQVDTGGGAWNTYLSVLRSNDLLDEPERGWYRASEELID